MNEMHELWDIANEVVSSLRLPPQLRIRLLPKYDKDDVVISIDAAFPDVRDQSKTAQTYMLMHLGGRLLALPPTTRKQALINRIVAAVDALWAHERDEWLTVAGVHVRSPHEPGHPSMILACVDLEKTPL